MFATIIVIHCPLGRRNNVLLRAFSASLVSLDFQALLLGILTFPAVNSASLIVAHISDELAGESVAPPILLMCAASPDSPDTSRAALYHNPSLSLLIKLPFLSRPPESPARHFERKLYFYQR